MGSTGTGERARRAGHTFVSASQRAGRVSAASARGFGRVVHRLSGASGAGRTGLSNLIELTAAGGVGDSFVAVALAGTLFFSTSVDQARGRVVLALLITIAPYALLAPLIGPLLDRVKQGNKYILMGTLLARGLLCWGMAGAINEPVTLLPAAFGVLLLQKVYGVTKSAVTPRLLPSEITLVTANSRSNLGSLIATSTGAVLALGVDKVFGGGSGGSAWVLRVGTVIYLAAMVMGLRLPDRVDDLSKKAEADSQAGDLVTGVAPFEPTHHSTGNGDSHAATVNGSRSDGHGQRGPGTAREGTTRPLPTQKRRFAFPHVGPVVGEAMRGNAAIRAFYGFIMFFLAFILRSERFGHISDTVALGGLAVAIAAGGMIGTVIGSALRSRSPQALMFTILAFTTVVGIAGAVIFGLWSILGVALIAAISATLVKAALDSILQREIPEETRASTFAFSETVHQLALVGGGLIGLALSLTRSGFAGLTVAAIGLALSLCWLLVARRRRIVRAHATAR